MADPRVVAKAERAKALESLTHHPGWKHLQEIADVRRAAYERQALSAAWAGTPLDHGPLALLDALEFILKQPGQAEHSFARAFARYEGTDNTEQL